MTIEIYASRLSDEGKEAYKVRKRQTLAEWLYRHGISRSTDLNKLAISLYLNGERLLPRQWEATEFDADDKVEIYREPKGTDPFSITFALVFGAKAVLAALMPKIPGLPDNSGKGQGKEIDEASAKGNRIKINDVRPECLGFNPARYPDVIVPGRRYFAAPREQRIEMCLAIGQGRYDIPPGKVKIGQTPLISLGDDASFTIYQPGESLAADLAHNYWYQAPEVGASSTGASGLELTVSSPLTRFVTASVMQFSDDTVSIPVGAGTFPSDWEDGLLIQIAAPYPYTVSDGTGAGGRDVISGDIAQLGFVSGDIIEIQGPNQGIYEVSSATATTLELNYNGGVPGTGLVTGPLSMAIGFAGLRYRILASGTSLLVVERLKSTGVVDTSWPGWTPISSNAARIQLDNSNLEGGFRGPFPATPDNTLATHLEYTVFYPGGIIFFFEDGTPGPIDTTHVFEWRDANVAGAWTSISTVVSAATLDAMGFTYRVTLPYPMRAECRIRREPSVITDQTKKSDTMIWYSLYAFVPASSPVTYPGMTVMTCNIRGGDRIAAATENLISVECTRILPVLRGGVWQAPQPTREISAAVGHIIRSVGYSDTTDIDLFELERLESTRWTPRGDTYDKVITDAETVKSYLQEVLQAGFSELTIDRGLLVPVRDEPRGPAFDHVYNPQVMLDPLSYSFTMPDQPDDFDGVDVEYFDHLTKQNETVECRLPGDAGTRVEKLKAEGICVRYKAWRWGMRRRRAHLYRQREYSFKTELDALNSAYFDYVALGVSTPGYGQSAELVGYTAGSPVVLESSEPLDWSTPGQYKVLVRRKDGSASGPYAPTRIDDYTFSIPTLDFVPDLSGNIDTPPIIQFGHESKWVFPALITDVSPRGTRTCNVKAVNYDARMYLSDDSFPPA
jgi:hypothetical protein